TGGVADRHHGGVRPAERRPGATGPRTPRASGPCCPAIRHHGAIPPADRPTLLDRSAAGLAAGPAAGRPSDPAPAPATGLTGTGHLVVHPARRTPDTRRHPVPCPGARSPSQQ